MKKKIKYSDIPPGGEPIGELEIIEDTFPRPEELVFKEDDLEIDITLSNHSINFFKNQAKKHNTQYQNLIRDFLEEYVTQHQDK